ncbi:MAG: Fe(2+)-trafficking protein [Phycisphaerae bacterium]|nr:Fe(2+)-trafficking protein [Phycisphaerae bacterium]
MSARTVHCAKLNRDLPGLDDTTPDGARALKMATLLGGPDLRQRIYEHVSAEAWGMWKDYMLMVINEYRLDPTSDASNALLREHLEAFLFGQGKQIAKYTPPTGK